MPDVIGARQNGRMHEHVRFVAGLGVIELGADMKAAGAPGQLVAPGQRAHEKHHLRRFRRAAHRRSRLHVHSNHELPIKLRGAGADELGERQARQRFGIDLGYCSDR